MLWQRRQQWRDRYHRDSHDCSYPVEQSPTTTADKAADLDGYMKAVKVGNISILRRKASRADAKGSPAAAYLLYLADARAPSWPAE